MVAAPDVQYVFDGAVELLDITADAHFYFMHIHEDVNGWMDRRQRLPLAELTAEIMADYLAWHEIAPRPVANAATITGLRSSTYQLREIEGMISHNVITAVRKAGHVGKKGLRKACSRKRIQRSARRDPVILKYCNRWRALIERAVKIRRKEFDAACKTINQLIDEDNRKRELEFRRATKSLQPITKRQRKARRKVVAKSYELLRDVTGEETAKAFFEGDRITITGREFDFVCSRGRSLHAPGHGNVKVEIADKQGVVLADLCVFLADSPAMDQVAALALYTMVGDERKILNTGNLFNIRDAGADHPILASRNAARVQENSSGQTIEQDSQAWLNRRWHAHVKPVVDRFLQDELGPAAAYAMENLPPWNPAWDYELITASEADGRY